MHWNYRVINTDGMLGIHEVYYNKKGEIEYWTEEPVGPVGENKGELLEDFSKIHEATELPTLDANEILDGIRDRINTEDAVEA